MIFRKTTILGLACHGSICTSIYASFFVLFAVLLSSFGFAQGTTLSPPSVQKQLVSGLDTTTWNASKWRGRTLVAWHQGPADAPAFALYDVNDHAIVTGAVRVTDAKSAEILDVATDDSGNSYVAAGALSNSGAIGRFIEKFDANGQGAGMIRTNPFQAQQVCSTGDGTVWALGGDEDAEGQNGKHAGYAILRHFDFVRGEIGATLQRDLVRWDFLGGPHHAFLACNAKSVGLYLPADSLWFEADADGHSSSVRRMPPLGAHTLVTGAAFTAAGGFFLTLQSPRLGTHGLFQLQKTDATHASFSGISMWTGDSTSQPIVQLLGSDGQNLVYIRNRTDSTVYWSAAP
jgi:hypothetical protein